MNLRELESKIRELIKSPMPDADVRRSLEELAMKEINVQGFTWLWGPALYARNRILFRPVITSQFGQVLITKTGVSVVQWKGKIGDALDAWLAEVDRNDDVQLFRRLYEWRLNSRSPAWRRSGQGEVLGDLVSRFRAAQTPAARHMVLQKFSIWLTLDEKSALALYETDPKAAGSYILTRLPSSFWGDNKRKLWRELFERANAIGDDEFRWALYRKQVPVTDWHKEVIALAKSHRDSETLCAELKRRHPEGWSLNVADTFVALVETRGREVLPYIASHLNSIRRAWFSFGRDGFAKLRDFARKQGWWEFWASIIRTSGDPKDFDKAVQELVDDGTLSPDDVRTRLGYLAGVSREWNFAGFGLARVHSLSDEVAVKLYQRFPEVLHGHFRVHVQPNVWDAKYPKLLDAALENADESLIDFLASRFVTRIPNRWTKAAALVQEAERLSHYYEGMRADEAAFSRRAAAVLGQIPAYAIWNYNELLRGNRLARLLFERSARHYLTDARSISDLVEAPEIHVQVLAYRALGLDLPAAREMAATKLPILLGTLLRPLHRTTRILAFGALANAATSLERARQIHDRARQALALPDTHYPKEQLVGLIGKLLHRWPELRSKAEQPTIYRRAA